MLSVSKHVVENDMSFFIKVNGCQEKQQKNYSYSLFCDITENNAKNEQQKHQVKIYTVITLSLLLITFFVL